MAVIDINKSPYNISSQLSVPGDNTSIVDNKFSLMPDTLGRFNSILPEVTPPFSDGLFSGDDIFPDQEGLSDRLALDFDSESAFLQEPTSADTVDVAETAVNGSPEVWIFNDKSVTELTQNPIWDNGLGALGTTTSLSSAGQAAAILGRFVPFAGLTIGAIAMLRQNESLTTEPNTFHGLTPKQRALATLPGFSPPPDGQIDPSSSTPAHKPGKANPYEGGNLNELPGTVSSPLKPPPTGLEGGSDTANVNPVILNTSPMLSLAEDLSNSLSVGPDEWPLISSDALGDRVNDVRESRAIHNIDIDGHNRMVSVIPLPSYLSPEAKEDLLRPKEKTSTVIDGRTVPYHGLGPKREGFVQSRGNELIQEYETLLKAKETFGLPAVEVEGFGVVDGEMPAIIYRTDGKVSFHSDMLVVSPPGTFSETMGRFDSETLTRMGELRTEFEDNRLFTSNSTQGARNLNLLFQSENGVLVPKLIEPPYIGSLNNAADLLREDGTYFFDMPAIFQFDIRDPEDGVTKDLDTIDGYVQRIERTIRQAEAISNNYNR